MADGLLPDEAIIVRGGSVTAEQLLNGCAEHTEHPGVFGFSVQCAPDTSKEELASAGAFPNRRISVSTVAKVRASGYDVIPTSGRGLHATVVVSRTWSASDAEGLLRAFEIELNPAPRR